MEEESAQREQRELSTQAVYWQRKQSSCEILAKENIELEEPQVDAGRSGRLVANSRYTKEKRYELIC